MIKPVGITRRVWRRSHSMECFLSIEVVGFPIMGPGPNGKLNSLCHCNEHYFLDNCIFRVSMNNYQFSMLSLCNVHENAIYNYLNDVKNTCQ